MTEKLISELPVAVPLTDTDVFIIEQVSEVESSQLSIAALLAHINTLLVTPVADDVAALELSIGNTGVSLEAVDGRLVIAEGDIDALQSAVGTINLSITSLDGRVTTLEADLPAEVLARQATTDEVVAARGAFVDLSARLADLAINAGKVSSVFGRQGDIVAEANDYTFEQIGEKPTTLAGYGINDAAPSVHEHSTDDITSGVLPIARGGTNGEGFRYLEADVAPTGEPIGTRWLNTTDGREYTLTTSGWVQWSGGQPIQGMEGGASVWGGITGTLADQTDLQVALDTKLEADDLTAINNALVGKADTTGEAFTGPVSATVISDTNGNVRNLLVTTANVATTLASTHLNKVIEKTDNLAYTYTIAPNLGVQGEVITIINSGTAGDVTIARGAGVALMRGTTDGSITVAPGTLVTLYRTGTANRWMA